MSELVDTAIRARIGTVTNIGTLAPGGIRNTMRAQGGSFPVVVFQLVSDVGGAQTFADGGVERLWYDVKVISPVDQQSVAGTLVDSIHDVLERGALSVTGKTHLQTMRVRRLPVMMETKDGVNYLTRGATYEVTVTA